MTTYGWLNWTFSPGDKIWFMGQKAKVCKDTFPEMDSFCVVARWAVPISIKGDVFYTIAHCENLKRRY